MFSDLRKRVKIAIAALAGFKWNPNMNKIYCGTLDVDKTYNMYIHFLLKTKFT